MSPITWLIIALAVILTTGGVSVWVGFVFWVLGLANQLAYAWAQAATDPEPRAAFAPPTFDE